MWSCGIVSLLVLLLGRVFNPNELRDYVELWNCVCRYTINSEAEDSWRWTGSPDGCFSTKDMYNIIVDLLPAEDIEPFPWLKLWWRAVPSKVAAFSWKAIRGRIPTKDNLLKRGLLSGQDTGKCPLCLGPVETPNHLLITCPVALLVWNSIAVWLGKSLLFSSSVRDHFVEFTLSEKWEVRRKDAGLIWQCTIWKIWKMRNGWIFKESMYTLDELLDGIKFCSWKWIRSHYPNSFTMPFSAWDGQPLECLSHNL